MDIQEKRALLEVIDILVKRPAQANEETLSTAIAYFSKLLTESTNGELKIVLVESEGA